jgi:hypothetical protein
MPTAASLGIGSLATLGPGLAASAVVDPITAYLTTGATEGSTMGTAISGAGGSSGAVGSGTFAGGLNSLGPIGQGIDNVSRAVTGNPLASIPGQDFLTGGLGRIVAPALGAIAGGIDAARGSEDTQTQQSRLDPNMQRLLYGDNGQGGLLNQANAFFQQNQGINPTAQQGLNMQKAFYTDPSYAQGFGQLRSQGLGLLGQPVAGNPFARGG